MACSLLISQYSIVGGINMADDDKKTNKEDAQDKSDDAEESSKKKSSPLLWIVIGLVGMLFMGGGGVATVLILSKDKAPTEAAKGAEEGEEDEDSVAEGEGDVEKKLAHFFPIRPVFVVNIPSKGKIKFLQVQVDIMSRHEDLLEDLEVYAPLVKSNLVSLFSGQQYEDLITTEGREALREKATELVKKVMKEQTGKSKVEQVLFTSFVTQ